MNAVQIVADNYRRLRHHDDHGLASAELMSNQRAANGYRQLG
jgi:hypothetical protein